MITDTFLAEPDAAEPLPGRESSADGAPGWLARQLRRDLFGVRLGVLLLIFPMFVVTMWMQVNDRHEWNHPPDSRYYLPMISLDMGHSLGDSVRIEREISPDWSLAPWYFADNDPTWQMVRTRVMYPVLSVPFVWTMGMSAGAMVIPIFGDVLFVGYRAGPATPLRTSRGPGDRRDVQLRPAHLGFLMGRDGHAGDGDGGGDRRQSADRETHR
ncbi:hypothetical protein ACFQ9X_03120 [Catenulispora yoronensis]